MRVRTRHQESNWLQLELVKAVELGELLPTIVKAIAAVETATPAPMVASKDELFVEELGDLGLIVEKGLRGVVTLRVAQGLSWRLGSFQINWR